MKLIYLIVLILIVIYLVLPFIILILDKSNYPNEFINEVDELELNQDKEFK